MCFFKSTYEIECSFSSLNTDGAVPPATETLFDIRRSTSLLPCMAYDCLRSLTSPWPCTSSPPITEMETFLNNIFENYLIESMYRYK